MSEAVAAPADRTPARQRIAAILVAAAALLALGLVVARQRNPWLFHGTHEYRARFASVAGLSPGDEVRYAGLDVGRVTAIDVAPGSPLRLLVTFRVRRDIPVRTDARATIPVIPIPFAHALTLRPGGGNAPVLPPGSVVRSEETPDVQEALTRLASILGRTDTVLQAAHPLMDQEVFERLGSTVARADTLVALATRGSARLLPEIERTTRRTNAVLARTDRLLAALDSSHAELATLPREAAGMMRDTRAALAELRDGIGQAGGLATLMAHVATTQDNLARLTTRLEREPASMLQRRQAPPKPVGPRP